MRSDDGDASVISQSGSFVELSNLSTDPSVNLEEKGEGSFDLGDRETTDPCSLQTFRPRKKSMLSCLPKEKAEAKEKVQVRASDASGIQRTNRGMS